MFTFNCMPGGQFQCAMAPQGVFVARAGGNDELVHRMWQLLESGADAAALLRALPTPDGMAFDQLPDFVLLAPAGEANRLLVHGEWNLRLEDGDHALGAGLLTWVEQLIPASQTVVICPAGAPPAPAPWLMRSGVAVVDWLEIEPETAAGAIAPLPVRQPLSSQATASISTPPTPPMTPPAPVPPPAMTMERKAPEYIIDTTATAFESEPAPEAESAPSDEPVTAQGSPEPAQTPAPADSPQSAGSVAADSPSEVVAPAEIAEPEPEVVVPAEPAASAPPVPEPEMSPESAQASPAVASPESADQTVESGIVQDPAPEPVPAPEPMAAAQPEPIADHTEPTDVSQQVADTEGAPFEPTIEPVAVAEEQQLPQAEASAEQVPPPAGPPVTGPELIPPAEQAPAWQENADTMAIPTPVPPPVPDMAVPGDAFEEPTEVVSAPAMAALLDQATRPGTGAPSADSRAGFDEAAAQRGEPAYQEIGEAQPESAQAAGPASENGFEVIPPADTHWQGPDEESTILYRSDRSMPPAGEVVAPSTEPGIFTEMVGWATTVRADLPGHRASEGNLQISDGTAIPLPASVIIGSDPYRDSMPGADADTPALVPVSSPLGTLSRNHLAVRSDNGRVLAQDLGSNSGTVLLRPGTEPRRIGSFEWVEMLPGDEFDLGEGIRISLNR